MKTTKKTVFQTGDILYGKLRPYLNKHDIARFDGICSTDILVYRTKCIQTAKFINYYMNTKQFILTAVSNSKGINLPRVSHKEIGNILINVPSLKEQTEIIRILEDFFTKEQQAKGAAEAVLKQIDLIKKSILARAFRGELGTNDPAEESAVELVKQVLEKSNDVISAPKARTKRVVIPKELQSVLSNANEEEIVRVLLKCAPEAVSIQTIMSISKKKFELMDALQGLEKKKLVFRTDAGEYLLAR